MILVLIMILSPYFLFMIHITFIREAAPYKLSRWDKQLFESVFVLLCSWLAYVLRDDFWGLVITFLFLFQFIPMLNIWWNCKNFGLFDSLVAHAIMAAALFTREYPYAPMALAVGGVSLQLVKNELLYK
ncbi:hypothetical protein PHJA_001659800 [Phtheirospermum japonicum]|uniref:Uncharacterized protein n=1 Tax=Phtheirospermum japonicum TaxID=374723 RepID=A0A830CFL8_9LAMI|nr:hypothetical protein PHJA_001659800 [Phtheirospermum japonicum]